MLSNEEQNEVFKQLKYNFPSINMQNWIAFSIDEVRTFIKNNKFGHDFLYEDAKYFHRSLDYSREVFDTTRIMKEPIIKDVFHITNPHFIGYSVLRDNLNLRTYFKEYFLRVSIGNDLVAKINPDVIPPMDALIYAKDLRHCDEKEVCFRMMEAVENVLLIIMSNMDCDKEICISKGDAAIETYEDKYLLVLMEMYNLVLLKEENHDCD